MRIILKDGSGEIFLKHLMEDVDRHGNPRLYFRRKGFSKVRLRAEIGTEQFLAEYKAALAATEGSAVAKPPPKPQHARSSLAWLIEQYKGSAAFRMLDDGTQTNRRRDLESLALTHGDKRYAMLQRKHLKAMRDAKADTPHAANNWLKTVRGLFRWAIDEELVEDNPARDVGKIRTASEGHHTWTIPEIQQFMAKWPASTKEGLALALLLYLGVRRSDLVKLGRQMEQTPTNLRLIEKKGRKQKLKITDLAIKPELRKVLDLHSESGQLTYLVTEYGRPFSAAGFGNWFKDRCRLANLPHCSAHGVRKAGATIAADNGASEHMLMAMFGWSDPAQARVYTQRANRKRLAASGSALLILEEQKSDESAPPKTGGGHP